jgi:hypothetical protein
VARFVFVHGAWHGGWCFERVAAELESRGHETWAPDLPCEEVGLTALDYAAVVGPQPDGVVVGHSLGGLTIPFVDARVTVFLAALVPGDHGFPLTHPEFRGTVRDDLGRSYWPDLETARARLYPDLAEHDAAFAFARLRRQAPLSPTRGLPSGRIESIVTSLDRGVLPEAQKRLARDTLGIDPHFIEAGHSPFLSHPRELAELLESLA